LFVFFGVITLKQKLILYALFSLFLLLQPLKAADISDKLLAWANQHPVATVAMEDNFPPFDYVDENGQVTGIGEVIRRKLSETLPITLQVTSKGSFSSQMDKLSAQQVDMVSVCAPTVERSETMLFSNAFLSLTPIVVTHKKSNDETTQDISSDVDIGIPQGYASLNAALNIVHEDNIVPVKDSLTGLEMVNSAQIGGLVTYLSVYNFFKKNHQLNNLQALPIEGVKPIALGFCVAQGNPELVALLNIGIDELGADYFNHLKEEWIHSLNGVDIGGVDKDLPLIKTILIASIAIILLLLLIHHYEDFLVRKFETFRFKIIYFSVLVVVFIAVFIGFECYFDDFKERIIEAQKESFDITNKVTLKALDDWYLPRLGVMKEITRDSELLPAVELLIRDYNDDHEKLNVVQTKRLNDFFQESANLAEKGRNYEIVMSDGHILLSSMEGGQHETPIKQQYPTIFSRALDGESVFVPPIYIEGATDPVVSIIEPIKNKQEEVIALLVVSFNATNNFSSLFNDVRLGSTVESYGLNQRGYLLSESRFIDQLHKESIVPFGQSAILTVGVIGIANHPIADDLRFKASGRNLDGYQDYMGATVAGQWSWLYEYNFMLVTELTIDEMYFEYTQLRNILFVTVLLSSAVIAAISLFMMVISHRSSQQSRLSQEKLEQLVDQRTKDLQRSERKNSLIVDSVADGILGLDEHGRIVFLNRAAERLLGYQESMTLLQHHRDVIYRCSSHRNQQLPQKTLIQKSLISGESRYVAHDEFCHRDGMEIPVSYNLSVIADDKSPFKAVLTFQDISQRLKDAQQTKALLTALPTAILLLNMDREIIDINNATVALLGYKKEYIVGKPVVHFIPENRKQQHEEILDDFFANPKPTRMGDNIALTVQTKSGNIIEVGVILSLMELNGEQVLAASVLDITETNHSKRLLIEAKDLADEASQSKSEFLANMSHEIRTPMNAIIGMSMLALQGTLGPKERNYVTKVNSAATNLLGIINDILDFSKIEADKLDLEEHPFALAQLLDNFSTVIGLKSQEKGLEVLFDISQDVPLFLNGDLLRLNQILINLGGNAVKFTDKGKVTLRASVLTIKGDRIKLQFSIQDSGIGINPEEQQKLFSAFSQADASTTRKYGGTGLGLSISKRLVNLMQGDIWVESLPGQGSEFFFTAWLKVEAHALDAEGARIQLEKPFSSPSRSLAGAHLLLVEDNDLNQELAVALLEGEGIIVTVACNGEVGVNLVQKNSYDCILMDIQMPVMDGYQATKLIREFNQSVPILAMTASAMVGDREKVIAAGMNDYISKPIDVQAMFTTIHRWVKIDDYNGADARVRSENSEVTAEVHSLFTDFSKIDQFAGIAVCNQSSELYIKILTNFEFSNRTFDEHFMKHWQVQSWDELERLVHSLKSGAGNIGAKMLYRRLNELELACSTFRNEVELLSLFDKVMNELTVVNEEITSMLTKLPQSQTIEVKEIALLTDSEIVSTLNELQKLVDGFDTRAQVVATSLVKSISDQKIQTQLQGFIAQLDNFDFDSANKILTQLKEQLMKLGGGDD